MPVSHGVLHDGDGSGASGDAASQPQREGPGAVLGGYPHRLVSERPAQTHRVPAASAECHGEIHRSRFI